MTKIIVLGGAGDMARRAVRELAAEPDVTQVTIADVNLEAAEELAAELNWAATEPKVRAVFVDANQHEGLVEAIRGHDAAASGIGPFYRYERPVALAAIEARVPYVSLCDDYDGVEAVLELDQAARDAGVTVLTGLGWTPGLSNLLARKGIEALDEAEAVHIAWGSSASDSEGYAVILHTMHAFTGMVPSRQYGWSIHVPAGSDKEAIRYPEPLGTIFCYHVGHPEPVTLPRTYPQLETVTLKGGLSEQPLNDLAIALARLRLTDTPAKKEAMGQIIKAALPALSQLDQPENPVSGIRVDVKGRRDGAPAAVSYGAVAHMNDLTALPLAIGALMLARGEIQAPGVVPPEAVIEPGPFLAELEKRGVTVEDMTGKQPVTVEAGVSIALPLAMLSVGLMILLILLLRRRGE
jgi:lysine 6-dehydrogenase